MSPPPSNPLEKVFAHIPGWLMLLCGLTILSAAILLPAWREDQLLRHQLAEVRVTHGDSQARLAAYQQFEHALATDDPSLLLTLAYYHLKLKPGGVEPIWATGPGNGPGAGAILASNLRQSPASASPHDLRPNWPAAPPIEAMIHASLAADAPQLPLPPRMEGRIHRLTSGLNRYVLLIAGMLCGCAGMLWPARTEPAPAALPA